MSVLLHWTDLSTNEVDFKVYRSETTMLVNGEVDEPNLPSPLDTLSPDTESYTDATVVAGTTYFWVVSNQDPEGRIFYSNEVTLTPGSNGVTAALVTFDPVNKGTNMGALTNGDLTADAADATFLSNVIATVSINSAVNRYWEFTVTGIDVNNVIVVGVIRATITAAFLNDEVGSFVGSIGYNSQTGEINKGGVIVQSHPGFVSGDIIGITLNANQLYFEVNGVAVGTPVTVAFSEEFVAAASLTGLTTSITANFGASSFAYPLKPNTISYDGSQVYSPIVLSVSFDPNTTFGTPVLTNSDRTLSESGASFSNAPVSSGKYQIPFMYDTLFNVQTGIVAESSLSNVLLAGNVGAPESFFYVNQTGAGQQTIRTDGASTNNVGGFASSAKSPFGYLLDLDNNEIRVWGANRISEPLPITPDTYRFYAKAIVARSVDLLIPADNEYLRIPGYNTWGLADAVSTTESLVGTIGDSIRLGGVAYTSNTSNANEPLNSTTGKTTGKWQFEASILRVHETGDTVTGASLFYPGITTTAGKTEFTISQMISSGNTWFLNDDDILPGSISGQVPVGKPQTEYDKDFITFKLDLDAATPTLKVTVGVIGVVSSDPDMGIEKTFNLSTGKTWWIHMISNATFSGYINFGQQPFKNTLEVGYSSWDGQLTG